uniref:Uncharacterized protein n=1 Tax=Fagus sylvatica TaxID=28930 RepID=A0A2N9GN44_FAGSY
MADRQIEWVAEVRAVLLHEEDHAILIEDNLLKLVFSEIVDVVLVAVEARVCHLLALTMPTTPQILLKWTSIDANK